MAKQKGGLVEQFKVITHNIVETLEIKWDGVQYALRYEARNPIAHFPHIKVILLNPHEMDMICEFRGKTQKEVR